MKLTEIYKAIGVQMLSDFEHIHSQIKHMGERGGEREAGLRTFLNTYLPSRYAVSNGEIVDIDGQTSHQCDLVIYDPFNCPLLLAGKDYRVFPTEPVLAMVEVKSELNANELEDAAEKIRSVKCLARKRGPIAGVIFAYKSAYKQDPIIKIASQMRILNAHLHPYEYADLLCVLDSGIIALINSDGDIQIPANPTERLMRAYHELDLPVLLYFFTLLLDLLDGQVSTMPPYLKYVGHEFEIGSVIEMDPSLLSTEEFRQETTHD